MTTISLGENEKVKMKKNNNNDNNEELQVCKTRQGMFQQTWMGILIRSQAIFNYAIKTCQAGELWQMWFEIAWQYISWGWAGW